VKQARSAPVSPNNTYQASAAGASRIKTLETCEIIHNE